MNLKPPENWRKGITKAMSEILGEQSLEERLAEIKGVIKRMDTRWDHGFFSDEQEYLAQRVKLIVERAYVEDDVIVAVTLRSNYHLVLNHKTKGPTYQEVDPLYACGSDGIGALTCIKAHVIFLPRHIV